MPEPVELIIFDCDGVLVDSEPLAMRVLIAAIAAQGVDITPDLAFRDYLGRSLESISDSLNASHGMHLGKAAIESMRHDLYALYRRELQPSAWLVEAISAVATLGVPVCVASSSGIERIGVSLEVTGLTPLFNGRIFSASMVTHGKPAPDLFLHAASEMGVPPARCIVIEDSPAGVTAAHAAGMRVFAYLGGSHAAPAGLAEAIAPLAPDARFEDMRCLPGLVALHQARAAGQPPNLLAAVDVGTASARAAIIDAKGRFLTRAETPFSMHRPDGDVAEHSADEIWSSACAAMRNALAHSGAAADDVLGLSFDATCSLVVRDAEGGPVTVSASGDARLDTISWMDHRAQAEAAAVTASGHAVLDFLGGTMSPEMQVPKLMWLKRHLPASWARAALLFDLSDFLSWRATGSLARSSCTLACKWTYLPGAGGWQVDFLERVGLGDLLSKGGLPPAATAIGSDIGTLTPAAADDLGLTTGCRVGMGMVDAHAGTLGAIGSDARDTQTLHRHLVLVGGTSSSVMALSHDPRPLAGVWGPFRDAVLPGVWLDEAGQSASGALLDHIVQMHAAGGEPTPTRQAEILARIAQLRAVEGETFAARLHVVPDFHGNRSPLGDPLALGVVSGLALDASFDGLCRLYYSVAVGLALGLRHILGSLHDAGYDTEVLRLVGGHKRNPLLVELYADAADVAIAVPDALDATLLGTAMAAATASGLYGTLVDAAAAMTGGWRTVEPNPARAATFATRHDIYLAMLRHRRELEALART